MQTYKNLGTSNSILDPVAKVIGSGETAKELADRTDVEVSQINTVATVVATDTTAKGAARTANTLAGALLDAVQRLEADEAGSAEPAKTSVVGVISGTADVPTSPSDPDIPFFLLAGALAGLAASFGVVALREVLRGEASPSTRGVDP
jgi:capsular polysaccharide biosynthesis protein